MKKTSEIIYEFKIWQEKFLNIVILFTLINIFIWSIWSEKSFKRFSLSMSIQIFIYLLTLLILNLYNKYSAEKCCVFQ